MGGWSADELRREADRLRRTADQLLWSFVAVLDHSRPDTFVGGPLTGRLATLLSDADRELRAAVAEIRLTADRFDQRAAVVESSELRR